ncbi:hypothetical protein M3Y97_00864500 [Aphelenchoides bicaudatus]|nr:hypothetical protein M3Y97_00864500 [Aphelenchoides bicaudatus]
MSANCGCKGARFCNFCIDSERVKSLRIQPGSEDFSQYKCYVFSNGSAYYCPQLNAQSSVDEIANASRQSFDQSDDNFALSGISLIEEFLSEQEEMDIVCRIDNVEWLLSQSGRRKQDYGPKVNFKHKKVKCERYEGVPDYADVVLKRLESFGVEQFGNYQPFELCNLEYDAQRQSQIEFHQDDTWIWGERLISLNLLESSVMTFENLSQNALVFVYMPRRSILCFCDEARYKWRHGIFSWHVQHRRIALTMREPGQDFKEGGDLYEKYGKDLIERGNRRLKTYPNKVN